MGWSVNGARLEDRRRFKCPVANLNHLFTPLEGVDLKYSVYMVGGAVRDALLGLSPQDVDFVAVGTTPKSFELRFSPGW